MPLSSQQQAVVDHPPGEHSLVIAVAGSGKSHTMSEFIAHLVEVKRVDPTAIVAVMFNTDAAEEMQAKLARRLGKRHAPSSRTFHGMGTWVLKELARGGFAEPWDFIGDPGKASRFVAEMITSVCKKHGHKYPRMVADDFLNFVDRVKGELLDPNTVWEMGLWPQRYDWFPYWYHKYEAERQQKRVRFFSDLIYDPVVMMQENGKAASFIAGRYKHIILDEYQDICESQQALIRFLSGFGNASRVTAVGDDDQTIYGWRGAKSSYILRGFYDDFPGAKTYVLDRTWRYGHALSCAANYVISGNSDRVGKLCISADGAPNTAINLIYEAASDPQPKVLIVVSKWLAQGGSLSDIAVLVRAYSKSAGTQFALLQAGIPFRVQGGDEASVLQNKWVASLIGWMALAAGHLAQHAYAGEPDLGSIIDLVKVINTPRLGLSWEKAGHLGKMVLQQPEDGVGFGTFASTHLGRNDDMVKSRVLQRGKLWAKLRRMGKTKTFPKPLQLATELMYFLDVENSIEREYDKAEDADEMLDVVRAFLSYVKVASKGRTLPEFMHHIQDLLTFSERAQKATEAILITSCHRSKGMEYPCVIMPSLYQGAFPLVPRSIKASRIEEHLSDERKLFYVAMTRAKRELNLLCPYDRELEQWLQAGHGGNCDDVVLFAKTESRASQFLYESNLYLSKALPAILAGGKGRTGLKASSPELINQYLDRLNAGIQIQSI